MRLIHPLIAAAFLAVPTIALAQAADTGPAGAPPAVPPSSAAATPSLRAGLPVKDKDGKPIGKVTAVKTDSSGKTVATIRMGADSFGVNASALAVDNDAARLNLTRSELSSYLNKGE